MLCSTDTVTISFLAGTNVHWVRLRSLASSFNSKGMGWVNTQAAVATSHTFRTPDKNNNINYLVRVTVLDSNCPKNIKQTLALPARKS